MSFEDNRSDDRFLLDETVAEYKKLEKRNAELEASNDRMRKALKWAHDDMIGCQADTLSNHQPTIDDANHALKEALSSPATAEKVGMEDLNKQAWDIVATWYYHCPAKCGCSFGGSVGSFCELQIKTDLLLKEREARRALNLDGERGE